MPTHKRIVHRLSEMRSQTGGTSLITLQIPSNHSMGLVTKSLTNELSTATNIRDKSVRKSVISTLKSALNAVKCYGYTAPENGLVLCAGETKYCV